MNILIENDTHLFWEEEGFLCFRYKVSNVDLEVAKKGLEARKKLFNKEPYWIFMDMRGLKSVTSEARRFYSSDEGNHNCMGTAALTEDALTRIIGSFYINFNRPKIPFKLFSTKEKAFQWLHALKNAGKEE